MTVKSVCDVYHLPPVLETVGCFVGCSVGSAQAPDLTVGVCRSVFEDPVVHTAVCCASCQFLATLGLLSFQHRKGLFFVFFFVLSSGQQMQGASRRPPHAPSVHSPSSDMATPHPAPLVVLPSIPCSIGKCTANHWDTMMVSQSVLWCVDGRLPTTIVMPLCRAVHARQHRL
jgi:hypothetical protein